MIASAVERTEVASLAAAAVRLYPHLLPAYTPDYCTAQQEHVRADGCDNDDRVSDRDRRDHDCDRDRDYERARERDVVRRVRVTVVC